MSPASRAALWMAGAIASFSLMAVATREVSDAFDTFGIMLYRGAVGVLLVGGLLAATGNLRLARPRRMGTQLLRNVIHFTGQNLWLYAIMVLPLAQVIALEFTSPLWVLLLAPALLSEPLTRRGLMAGLLGFAGVLVVARPWSGGLHPGLLAAAACAAFFALTAIVTKRLTRTEPVAAILLWLNVIQLGLAAAAVSLRGGVAWPEGMDAAWLLAIGVAGSSAHWCLTSALRAAPASTVMPLDFLRLPVSAALGWLLFGEAVGLSLVAGAALILLGNTLTLKRARGDVASELTPS